MATTKIRKFRWSVVSAETDAIQYKSYKPVLAPSGDLIVEVDIPEGEIVEVFAGGKGGVVTPAGLAYMLGELAHGMYRDNARRVTANSKRRDD